MNKLFITLLCSLFFGMFSFAFSHKKNRQRKKIRLIRKTLELVTHNSDPEIIEYILKDMKKKK